MTRTTRRSRPDRERDLAPVVPPRARALVVGLTIAAGAAASAARRSTTRTRSTRRTPAPCPARRTPTQIDSWLQVNPDNTVTLFHGVAELGQGTPTAMRQIAAEELGLAMEQVTAAQLDTNVVDQRVRRRLAARPAPRWARRTCAAPRRPRARRCSSSPRRSSAFRSSSLSVDKGVVSGGGKTVKYGDLMAGKLFQSTIAAQGATLTDPSKFKVIGTRVPRIDIPDDRHRHARPSSRTSACRGCSTAASSARAGRAPSTRARSCSASTRARSSTSTDVAGRRRSATSSASSRRRSTTRSRPRAQLKVKWDETPKLPGNGNLAAALRDPANLAAATASRRSPATSAPASRARRRCSRQSYFTALPGPRADRPELRDRGRRAATRRTVLCMAQGPYTTRAAIAGALEAAGHVGARPGLPGLVGTYGHGTYDDVSISAALHLAGGRQAGARAVHALGRARLGPVRPGPGDRHPRRHRRQREDRRLRLHLLAARLDAGRRVGRAARRRHRHPGDRAGRQRRHDQRRLASTRSRTAASRASGSTATTASSRASGSAPLQRRSRCSPPSR